MNALEEGMEDEAEGTSDRQGVENGDGDLTTDDLQRLTEQVAGLEQAVVTRDVIGQAKGILMERYRITAEEAFARLRTVSQQENRKLRDIAEELATTGLIPDV